MGRGRSTRAGGLPVLETLEPRLLLAGSLVISEFLANNNSTFFDPADPASNWDWIEIHNVTASPVSLNGWSLKDGQSTWNFPTGLSIGAGGYYVVYASGKDLLDGSGRYHTNFSLDKDGEYLGLWHGGPTAEHEYAPFPKQVADVSYGVGAAGLASTKFVGDVTPVRYLVPTSEPSANWKGGGAFDDSLWDVGAMGVGFDLEDTFDPHVASDVEAAMYEQRTSLYLRAVFALADRSAVQALVLRAAYDDGYVAYLNGTKVAQRSAPASPAWDSAATAEHSDAEAVVFEDVDISACLSALVNGTNVLAVHGLNLTADDDDFLASVELHGDVWVNAAPQYYATPTRGTANSGGSMGFVADTKFSADRGFYDAPFDVVLSTDTPGASIYYTLDGSKPTTSSTKYTAPVPITTTTYLRAFAHKPGWTPTDADCQTYIFLDDVVTQTRPSWAPVTWTSDYGGSSMTGDYDMDQEVTNHVQSVTYGYQHDYSATIRDDLKAVPTISVVMNRDDFLGPAGTGIYVTYAEMDKPCSVELLYPTPTPDAPGFQSNAAIEIVGGSSDQRWKMTKLSLRVKFRPDAANPDIPGSLDYPLFGPDAAQRFDTFILDAEMNNTWNYNSPSQQNYGLYNRDQFAADLQNLAGGFAPHGFYAHLYLNGLYWGMYWIHERPDESFASAYLGGEKADYYVMKHNTSWVVYPDPVGDPPGAQAARASYGHMVAHATAGDYGAIQQDLDIDDFIDYMLINFYIGNNDWAHQNWYASRNHVDPDGRWRFHSWDAEHILEDAGADRTTLNQAGGPTAIHQGLLAASAEYRLRFADHVQRLFFNGGLLTPEGAKVIMQDRLDEIDRAVVGESARWGDSRVRFDHPYIRGSTDDGNSYDWLDECNRIVGPGGLLSTRTATVLDQLQAQGLYPADTCDAPAFYINGAHAHGGAIGAGDLFTMDNPDGAENLIYYTLDGTDPRLPGGDLSPAAVQYTGGIDLAALRGRTDINARVRTGGGTSTPINLVTRNTSVRYLVPGYDPSTNWRGGGSFDDSAWSVGSMEIGFDLETTFDPYIRTDVQSALYNQRLCLYMRVAFNVADKSAIAGLTLRVRYDDGFVAWLNGTYLTNRNGSTSPNYQTTTSVEGSDAQAVVYTDIDITSALGALQNGANILAIQGIQCRTRPSGYWIYTNDFLLGVELVSPGGSTPVTWSALAEAVYTAGAPTLRVTELMYNPPAPSAAEIAAGYTDASQFEYVELKNIGAKPVSLAGLAMNRGLDFKFPSQDLAAGDYAVIARNPAAFQFRYPSVPSSKILGKVRFQTLLDNAGEWLRLADPVAGAVQEFEYKDGWFDQTDGGEFSLVVRSAAQDAALWGQKEGWRSSWNAGGSPAAGEPAQAENPEAVVLSEVLAHQDVAAGDWIELYNTTDHAINLGGWYLSDSKATPADLKKYRIADGTTIAAHGYLVLTEATHFGGAFALSEYGEQVVLSSPASASKTNPLTTVAGGYREDEQFGASPNGMTFGRYAKSAGGKDFVLLSAATSGTANAYPLVGPVVINEVMYNPATGGDEYIELYNLTGSPAKLYYWEWIGGVYVEDPTRTWQFRGGIGSDAEPFALPDGATIPAYGYALVVEGNPATFRTKYGVPAEVPIWGPYGPTWSLDNGGETIELYRPDHPDGPIVPYVRVDRVTYDDDPPWPGTPLGVTPPPLTSPDGGGPSLERVAGPLYGNDAVAWAAGPSGGTPGRANAATPATEHWAGTADDHWENRGNWQAGFVPGVLTGAVLEGSPATQPILYQDEMVKSLDLRSAGWTVDLNGHTLTVGAAGLQIVGGATPTSRVDVGTGAIILDYDGAASPLASAAAWIRSGRHGGDWTGCGITSSAVADPLLCAVGLAQNDQLILPKNTFGGQTVDPSSVLMKYTYAGDANLDGVIDIDDYGYIDQGYELGLAGWMNGDFNHDGVTDIDDYGLIDYAIEFQGAPLAAGGAAGSPEPVVGVVVALQTSAMLALSADALALVSAPRAAGESASLAAGGAAVLDGAAPSARVDGDSSGLLVLSDAALSSPGAAGLPAGEAGGFAAAGADPVLEPEGGLINLLSLPSLPVPLDR